MLRPNRWMTAEERFSARVRIPDDRTRCWEWTGSLGTYGYGHLNVNGRHVKAHRWSYERSVGPIPPGLQIDHLCRNRACVNPAHMEPVTTRENILRGTGFSAINSRKTHCPKGHRYETEGRVRARGDRECRECDRTRHRKQYHSNRLPPDTP